MFFHQFHLRKYARRVPHRTAVLYQLKDVDEVDHNMTHATKIFIQTRTRSTKNGQCILRIDRNNLKFSSALTNVSSFKFCCPAYRVLLPGLKFFLQCFFWRTEFVSIEVFLQN